jgi:zinc transport system ATP-binding protein
MKTTPVIAIRDLSFSYDGHLVLEDVNLTIGERDFVCIVGPNGGGKTTLLRLALGILQPTRGSVRVFGMTPTEARSRLGYLPQHAEHDPIFPISVMDVVLTGRLGHGRFVRSYSRADKTAAAEALAHVGLADARRRSFSSLSGGQKQRVLIARALACEPDLLLFDEPTAGLDLAVENELYDLLRNLNSRLTIVLVSHDLGFVSQIVKSVVCVKRKVTMHPTSEVTGEIISEIYGGDVRMVRHDHRCAEEGHECLTS